MGDPPSQPQRDDANRLHQDRLNQFLRGEQDPFPGPRGLDEEQHVANILRTTEETFRRILPQQQGNDTAGEGKKEPKK